MCCFGSGNAGSEIKLDPEFIILIFFFKDPFRRDDGRDFFITDNEQEGNYESVCAVWLLRSVFCHEDAKARRKLKL